MAIVISEPLTPKLAADRFTKHLQGLSDEAADMSHKTLRTVALGRDVVMRVCTKIQEGHSRVECPLAEVRRPYEPKNYHADWLEATRSVLQELHPETNLHFSGDEHCFITQVS